MNLDDVQAIRELDSENMLGHISNLPEQCRAAWEHSQRLTFPSAYDSVDQVVIVGMGGSAIGGTLVEGLVSDQCEVPISVVRGYTLPRHVRGHGALVVASSYSGNTEETLACFGQALERDALAMAITTGGKLAELAAEASAPVVTFQYESQPRAALGYSLVLLLGTLHRLGLVPDYSDDVIEASDVMMSLQEAISAQVPAAQNAAKQLAVQIHGALPVVCGATFLAAAANRWKTQFNENAKHWAFFEVLPEMNHNAVVGFGIPPVVRDNAILLMLQSSLAPRRIEERWDATRETLEREGVRATEVHGWGRSAFSHMLSLIHFGDYVSFYLAMLNQVDPTPIESIAFLKRRLAELGEVAS